MIIINYILIATVKYLIEETISNFYYKVVRNSLRVRIIVFI